MHNPSRPNSTMAQSEMDNQKGKNGMNKRMALARRLIPVVVALAVLVGALGTAPAAHADNCAYFSDGYLALCPGGSNYSLLYQYYNGQWNQVATVVFSGTFIVLSSGGATIAQNTANGEMWVFASTAWLNVTGMNSTQINNALVAHNMSNNLIRHTQVMMGLPSVWP